MTDVTLPQVDGGEAEPYGEGDEAAADVHVVLVGDREDDDEQEGGAEGLVHGQGVEVHLEQDPPVSSLPAATWSVE